MSNLLYKWNLYNLSLIPLYFIFIIQYTKIDPFFQWDSLPFKEYFHQLISQNWQAIFFITMILLALFTYMIFKKDSKYGNRIPIQFQEISPSNFDHLTFLSTYIIPLITFDLNNFRSFFVVIILLIMIGIIYIKSNLYYLNPTLLLFGYKIYKAKNKNQAVILIAKRNLRKMSDKLAYKDLGNNIYLIKG